MKTISPKNRVTEEIDILILHGRSIALIDKLRRVLKAVGYYACTVEEQPTVGLSQGNKVKELIKKSKICLAVLTFNDEDKNSTGARPNVYDELSTCGSIKRRNTIVLLEKKGNKYVTIPSNRNGVFVPITFEKRDIVTLFEKLFIELRPRIMALKVPYANKEVEMSVPIIKEFVEKMNLLWNNEIEHAWKCIERRGAELQFDFADSIDAFANQYTKMLDYFFKDYKNNNSLRKNTNNLYKEAYMTVVKIWEIVSDGTMEYAKNENKKEENATKASSQEMRELFAIASEAHTESKRKSRDSNSDGDRIVKFRKATELLKGYIKKF